MGIVGRGEVGVVVGTVLGGLSGWGWEGGGRGREGGGGVEGGGSRGRVVVVSVVWIIRFTQSNLARFFCEFTLLPLDSRCRIVDPNPLDRSQGTRVEGARVVAVTAAEAVVVAVIVAGAGPWPWPWSWP